MNDSNSSSVKRTLSGQVVSDKMDKTITVVVERLVRHPVYGKYMKRSSKFHVHDAGNVAKRGDTVEIKESRPYSKTKCWSLIKVI
jgi:small subunit ribosomal protein S17